MSSPSIFNVSKLAAIVSGVVSFGSVFSVQAQDSDNAIEEVFVFSQKTPYRGGVSLDSLPQQVQVLSAEDLSQTGKFDFQNAIDLAGGVARQNSFGGLWDSFAIRGFAGDENLPSAYLINGFSGGRGFSGNRDNSNIEAIEVLKGPGSALYGRGEPGGTINIVTKKPQFEKEGYVQASAGRFNHRRIEGDYTDALINDTLAVRINGSYKDSDSFRDTISTEKLVLTPSFLLRFSEATSLNYELEYLHQETPFDRGIVAVDYDPEVMDISTFLGEPQDGPIEIDALGHQFVLEHQLSADWTILGGIGIRSSSFEGKSSDIELSSGRQSLVNNATDSATNVNRQIRVRDYDAEDYSARFELTGAFATGPFEHHLLVGLDGYDYELDSVQQRWRDAGGESTYYVDYRNPVYGQAQPGVSDQTDRLEEQENFGFYVQDQIDLANMFKFLLGLRYDDFSQTVTNRLIDSVSKSDETAVSPRAGIVFETSDYLSLYASYSEGFRPNSGADAYNESFEPEESRSREVGAKISDGNGNLSLTVALFRMEKSNILTSDPVNSGFSAALGAAESKGLEIDLEGNINDNLSIMFNYAYVDAGTKTDLYNFDWGVNVPAGSDLINIPKHQANFLLSQDFTLAGAPATLGFGINYVDDRLGETIDPNYRLPSYTLFNVFGSYEITKNMELSFNIDNITNEKHYVSSYHKWWTTPGAPLTWTLNAKYKL